MKTKPFRVGKVSVRPLGKDRWLVRYDDPATGRDVRRRMTGLDESDVLSIATHINHKLLADGGYIPEERQRALSIADALAEAIELADTRPETQQERARRAAKFVEWLNVNHPSVETWCQLRPAALQQYVNQLGQEKARNTIRLDIQPVLMTWKYMSQNYPDLVKPLPRIRLKGRAPEDIQCLSAREVARLLDWMKVNAGALYPLGCLQGLAGLRVLEAAAIRAQDVDLVARTVTITATAMHEPKNAHSERIVPVCDEVLAALRGAIMAQKVRPATGELFTSEAGTLWQRSSLCHRWTYTLRRAARDLEEPRFGQVPARKLRAAFVTMADRMNAPDRLLKAYIGHASGDVLGQHYRRIDIAELRTVSALMNGWREAANRADLRQDFGNSPECSVVND